MEAKIVFITGPVAELAKVVPVNLRRRDGI